MRKIARWTCSSLRGSNEPSKPIRIKKIHSHLIKGFINPGTLYLPRSDGRGKYIILGLINPGIHRIESH